MRFVALPLIVVLASPSAFAAPPNKKQCIASSDAAQDLRAQGKLLAARDELAICANEACPGVLRKDCINWLNEVQGSIPTVVLGAKEEAGSELIEVVVTVDGKPLSARLDGKAIAIDPGAHTFTFAVAGRANVDVQVLLTEGDKNHRVQAVFPTAAKPKPIAEPPPPPPRASPSYALPITLGAVGLVSLGAFAYFGISGSRAIDDYRESCSPRCNPDDVDAAKRKLVYADISLGIGIATLGVATVLFLATPRKPAEHAGLHVTVGQHGALATWTASF